jgi:hypothetical protein
MEKTIANFPPEVFASLTFYLPYDAIETLFRVNNRRVNAILTQLRGCLQLSCETTNKNPRWPALVCHLQNLTSLIITSRLASSNAKARLVTPKTEQLNSLPRSLVTLKFTFPEAESCWCATTSSDTGKKEILDIGSILPNLQRLELSGASEWTDSMVSVLPSSLTLLYLEQNDALTDECVQLLPVNLSHLWLPRNAKMLKNGNLASLKHLVSLRLAGSSLPGPGLSASLPAGLIELELPSNKVLTSSDVAHLPSKLTKLNLQLNSTILPSSFASFPTSLQALNISSKVEDGHISLLPPNMVALALNDCTDLSPEAFGKLPRTLTHFTAWKANQIPDEAVGLLPRSLKHLYLDAPLTDLAATAFPVGLLTLKLREAQVGSEFMKMLHLPSLTRLELSGEEMMSDDIQLCPRSLRYLHLTSSAHLSPNVIPFLPPNIRVLSFISSSGFKNLTRSDFPSSLIAFYSADLILLPEIF